MICRHQFQKSERKLSLLAHERLPQLFSGDFTIFSLQNTLMFYLNSVFSFGINISQKFTITSIMRYDYNTQYFGLAVNIIKLINLQLKITIYTT